MMISDSPSSSIRTIARCGGTSWCTHTGPRPSQNWREDTCGGSSGSLTQPRFLPYVPPTVPHSPALSTIFQWLSDPTYTVHRDPRPPRRLPRLVRRRPEGGLLRAPGRVRAARARGARGDPAPAWRVRPSRHHDRGREGPALVGRGRGARLAPDRPRRRAHRGAVRELVRISMMACRRIGCGLLHCELTSRLAWLLGL